MPSKGKILFVLEPEIGLYTNFIRGLIFKDELINRGWQIRFVGIKKSEKKQELNNVDFLTIDEIACCSKEYDIVYLLKISSLSLIRKIKKKSNAKIIFDLTDALWRFNFRIGGWYDIERILQESDVIISENQYVCSYGYLYNKTVFSIPACTQIELFDQIRDTIEQKINEKIRIGWIGSPSTIQALKKMIKPIKNIYRRHKNIELRILGAPVNAPILNQFSDIECVVISDYDEATMIHEVLNFDIGIFPPPGDIEDYKIRGALKGMVYMSAGVPTIFQKAGDCLNFIQDGENGIFANNPQEWEEKLESLIISEPLREKIGMNGYLTVREKHSRANIANIMDTVFMAIMHMYVRRSSPDIRLKFFGYFKALFWKILYILRQKTISFINSLNIKRWFSNEYN